MKVLVLVTAMAATLAVGGCTSGPGPAQGIPTGAGGAQASAVDVDTPALQRLKRRAQIAPCPSTDPARAPVDSGLPAVTLPCLGGGRDVHLPGLRGKPTVLNLWASWCTPCREELPVLQKFHERAQGKVAMLGVDFEDTQPDAALQLLARSGVTYPQVADFDKEIDQGLGRHPVPMTVLVDADGNVVSALPMQATSADQLASLVKQSLGVRV